MAKATHVEDLDNIRLQNSLAQDNDQPWYVDTPCKQADDENPLLAEAWFDQEDPLHRQARAICDDCPVRALCVQDAVIRQDAYGLRGGIFFYLGGFLSTEENAKMKNKYMIKGKVRNSAKDADKIDW